MKFCILLASVIILSQSLFCTENSNFYGKITNIQTNKPLTGVLIIAVSGDKSDSAVSDRYGKYNLQVQPGRFSLSFMYFLHQDTLIQNLDISPGESKELNVAININTESWSEIRYKKNKIEREKEKAKTDSILKVLKSEAIEAPEDSVFYTDNTDSKSLQIVGNIYDWEGTALVGAAIKFVGTKKGAFSKKGGNFKIVNIASGTYELSITHVGYQTKRMKVDVRKGQNTNVRVIMIDERINAKEIIVTKKSIDYEEKDAMTGGASMKMDVLSSPVASMDEADPLMPSTRSSVKSKMEVRGSREGADGPKSVPSSSDDKFTGTMVAMKDNDNIRAGTLTSGEVNDFRKWELWKDISEDQLKSYHTSWSFNLKERYTVQLVTLDNRPVIDCEVRLISGNNTEIWTSKTDNTGKAELWANVYEENISSGDKLRIEVSYKNKKYSINDVKKFKDGVNILRIDDYCNIPGNVDIAFLVDATGSMGDEINYLKTELDDIITKAKEKHKDKNIKVGSIFYRDINDSYLIRKSNFDADIKTTIDFINKQGADGGGDTPEAVEMGLMTAINELNWSEKAIARIVFLILDAPSHTDKTTIKRLKEITAKAALSGIRIVPVVCSGSDKSCEYIMRAIALATNGTYVFLTDHSGVGGKHIEPTTDKYDVELMNNLFLRLIDQFTVVPECSGDAPLAKVGENNNIFNQNEKQIDISIPDNKDFVVSINCYPNPTSGELNVEIINKLDELYLTDIAGKLILKMERLEAGKILVDLHEYPTGVYFLKFMVKGKWGCQKVMLLH